MQSLDAGLKEFKRVLDWHQSTADPMGQTRVMLRDILAALAEAGLHRLVVILDAHLPKVAMIGPGRAIAAVEGAMHESSVSVAGFGVPRSEPAEAETLDGSRER